MDFSSVQRREWSEMFKVLNKKNNYQPRILYPVKLPFKSKRKTKTFSNKKILWEFIVNKPTLPELLKRFFREKKNGVSQKLESA